MAKRREYAHERRARLAKEAARERAPAVVALPKDEAAFVAAVYAAAAEVPADGRFGRYHVYVSALAEQMHAPLDELKARLLAAHRAGLLTLSRADLTSAMDRRRVEPSEIDYLGLAKWHFLDVSPRRNPLSLAEGRAQRKALLRQIDRDLRVKAKAKLVELRAKVRQLVGHKKAAIKETAARCKREHAAARERAKTRRLKAIAELRAAIIAERAMAKTACSQAKREALTTAADAVERARLELEAERRYQADLRRIEGANRVHRRESKKTTSYERRQESDDEVRSNIPADFVALWEKVKRGIKGDTRQSRTEAFLKYAEEHPHETYAAIDDVTDRKIREFQAQHEKLRPYTKARKRPYTDAELAAVPF